jgi:hypothetical protein
MDIGDIGQKMSTSINLHQPPTGGKWRVTSLLFRRFPAGEAQKSLGTHGRSPAGRWADAPHFAGRRRRGQHVTSMEKWFPKWFHPAISCTDWRWLEEMNGNVFTKSALDRKETYQMYKHSKGGVNFAAPFVPRCFQLLRRWDTVFDRKAWIIACRTMGCWTIQCRWVLRTVATWKWQAMT